ncbi:MAG: hypothetical protein HFG22_10060 [Lachnospiraceae bacterium]|nr:hypothetical protein [Lachnospiraceae bacterium]
MKQSRIQLLKQIYEHEQITASPLSIPIDNVSRFDVSYLESEGYLTQSFSSIGAYHLSLTEKGERYVVDGLTPETATPPNATFNFSNATFTNSVVGSGISGNQFTFHNSPALTELETLIRSKPADDQATLNEMLEMLREIQSSEKPIEKGRLSRFYEVVKKSSDLVLPIGKFFFDIFFRLGA